jgi:mannitol/fructose-specific phosphotransferase system IIA component (Ntr-type)
MSVRMRQSGMNFGDLVQPGDVVLGVRAPDVSAAAAQLLEKTLSRRKFPPAEITRLVNAVIERERDASTLCGPIAIPHARDAAIQSFLAAVAINPDGIIEGAASPRVGQ